MQCKDCLREIDEKEYFNRSIEGICKKCRQKISQIKYENKKFGRNREYIPERLKDNKLVISSRKNKVVATTVVEKPQEKSNKIYDERIEKLVLEDIANTFKANNVTINPQDIPPFHIFMEMFISLIDINNGYMSQYKKAEEVFNMMEGDYQHAYEDAKTPDIFFERSQMFRCLLDQRRNIKNGIGQYDEIIDLLQDIVKKNPKILETAKKAQEGLNRAIQSQEGHFYKVKASELIAKEDFCIGKRNWGRWHVEIPIMNYYNNAAPFNFTQEVWADGEEDAKNKVKTFLKQKFPNCPYNDTKFKINKIEDEVCL